jgi:putative ABC transport system ATP-binding protein
MKWCDIRSKAHERLFPPMVTLTDVSKVYTRGDDRIYALDRVSLDVSAGTFCAFVGPSGCGKSTLLNVIAGLDLPTSGTIDLEGRSTAGFSSDDWTRIRRQSIGIVFQAFHLIPGLTVEENVAFPLLLRGEKGGRVRERVADVLTLVRMTPRATHRPSELSGGEQQRVAIARAIVHAPKIILADEPTGNLDSQHGAEIITLLRTLVTQFHHTVLLVTHSGTAADAADYIWAMKDGRLTTRTMQAAAAQGV